MCANSADPVQGVTPECIDWAALSAIGGDHSCSAASMLETALRSDWILAVADVAAQLKEDLARIPVTAPRPVGAGRRPHRRRRATPCRRNQPRESPQRAAFGRHPDAARGPAIRDPRGRESRAFLLPRPDTGLDPLHVCGQALKPGAPLNAIGVYVWYHISALQMASSARHERPFSGRAPHAGPCRALRRGVCAAFPRRHLCGRPRRRQLGRCVAAQRHARLLQPERDGGVHVEGARAHDRADGRCAHAPAGRRARCRSVRKSIGQVLDAAAGRSVVDAAALASPAPSQPDSFDVCKSLTFPTAAPAWARPEPLRACPRRRPSRDAGAGLGPGLGALPRCAQRSGPFVGVAASLSGRAFNGGFEVSQNDAGLIGSVDMGFGSGSGSRARSATPAMAWRSSNSA